MIDDDIDNEEDERPRRSKKDQNRNRRTKDPNTEMYKERRDAEPGPHPAKKETASRRFQKHKKPWFEDQDFEEDEEEFED
jgi:hypothetical protein